MVLPSARFKMSELGNFISSQIKLEGIPSFEMASRLGLHASHLSQITTGRRRGYNPETVARMMQGISDDPDVRAKFLEAYFRDQTIPKLKNWVRVHPPDSKRTREDATEYGNGDDAIKKVCALLAELALPTDTVHDLRDLITAIPHYSALHDLIRDLAAFTRDAFHIEPGTVVLESSSAAAPLSPSAAKKKKRSVRYSARSGKR